MIALLLLGLIATAAAYPYQGVDYTVGVTQQGVGYHGSHLGVGEVGGLHLPYGYSHLYGKVRYPHGHQGISHYSHPYYGNYYTGEGYENTPVHVYGQVHGPYGVPHGVEYGHGYGYGHGLYGGVGQVYNVVPKVGGGSLYNVPSGVQNVDYGVGHHEGYGVGHHEGYGVVHHEGYGVIGHHEGYGVTHGVNLKYEPVHGTYGVLE